MWNCGGSAVQKPSIVDGRSLLPVMSSLLALLNWFLVAWHPKSHPWSSWWSAVSLVKLTWTHHFKMIYLLKRCILCILNLQCRLVSQRVIMTVSNRRDIHPSWLTERLFWLGLHTGFETSSSADRKGVYHMVPMFHYVSVCFTMFHDISQFITMYHYIASYYFWYILKHITKKYGIHMISIHICHLCI